MNRHISSKYVLDCVVKALALKKRLNVLPDVVNFLDLLSPIWYVQDKVSQNKNKIQSDLKIQYEIVCLRGALPFKTKFLQRNTLNSSFGKH